MKFKIRKNINEDIKDDEKAIESALENVLAIYIVDDAKTSPVLYDEQLTEEDTQTDSPINASPAMVNALLNGLKKCKSIYIEPTYKNSLFMRDYNLTSEDYLNIFNQLKSSDFTKALHSTLPKYQNDLLFVFQSSDIKLEGVDEKLKVYVKVNISKSAGDCIVAISFHRLNQFESLDEDTIKQNGK